VVLERLSTRQVCTFCGLLPEIGRAWATVDASLFLWRYDVNQCARPRPRRARA